MNHNKNEISGREELCRLLDEGHKAVTDGRVQPLAEAFEEIRRKHGEPVQPAKSDSND